MPETAQLNTLLDLKVALLERVWELGQRQLDLISTGDYAELLKLLGVKQRVLGGLQDVETGLRPFHHGAPAARASNSAAERVHTEAQLQRCEELLRMILRQEQSSEQGMIVRRDEAAAQLQGLHHAAAIQAAYQHGDLPLSREHAELNLLSSG
jgi:PAS domain-containing protein